MPINVVVDARFPVDTLIAFVVVLVIQLVPFFVNEQVLALVVVHVRYDGVPVFTYIGFAVSVSVGDGVLPPPPPPPLVPPVVPPPPPQLLVQGGVTGVLIVVTLSNALVLVPILFIAYKENSYVVEAVSPFTVVDNTLPSDVEAKVLDEILWVTKK